jgi:E3 Ubiquitin ligase
MDWGDAIALVLLIGVPAAIGIACLWYRAKVGRELALIASTPPSRAGDIAATAPGTLVEVAGPLRCDALLSGEFSQQKCIYYRALVEREIEYYERDSQGRRERRTRRETVQENVKFSPCVLDDGSGRVPIHFEGAEVEGVQTHNKYESSGSVASLVGSVLGAGGGEIGRYYTETSIPPDVPVFILGTVQADHSIGAAPSKKTPFVITHKSKEERTKSLASTRMWMLIIAVVCFAISIGLGVLAGQGLRNKAAKQKATGIERLVPPGASYLARLNAPASRSSAVSRVASRLAKQKRTTERIGSPA